MITALDPDKYIVYFSRSSLMERAIERPRRIVFPESLWFLVKSGLLLAVSGAILYLLLVATYPPIHDALHDFRHSLAVVPCH